MLDVWLLSALIHVYMSWLAATALTFLEDGPSFNWHFIQSYGMKPLLAFLSKLHCFARWNAMSQSNRRTWLCGLEFVQTPILSYSYSLSVLAWWTYNNFLFYFVLFFPRILSSRYSFYENSFSTILFILYTYASVMCLTSFLRSMFTSPGVLTDDCSDILSEKVRIIFSPPDESGFFYIMICFVMTPGTCVTY